ncbi:hypothetical protein Lalb_Chr14g0372401 [Lupinus albus]|uniref:Uncharacterized protein n=1 Tax=Lupinus albus TaxID=3870 RepID=A0A6A4PFU9_LUPAL|nr:hypothetical protein Lalb_Chr14g0372401 [Lupinus albus]
MLFLLLIRGTHTIKDTLIAATNAVGFLGLCKSKGRNGKVILDQS